MLLFFISPLCTTESLDAEDAPDHLPRPPAQQGEQEETSQDPEASLAQPPGRMLNVRLQDQRLEIVKKVVHRKPDRHRESRHHDAEKDGHPAPMQIGNNPEGHDIGSRAGKEKRKACPGRDSDGEKGGNHRCRPGCTDVDRNSKYSEKQDLQVSIGSDKPAILHQWSDQRGHHELAEMLR